MSSPTENPTGVGDQAADAEAIHAPPLFVEPTPPTTGYALVADSDDTDADSAIGDSVSGSHSASLASSVTNYIYENGRRYHSYREGQYPLPNDETEQDRLDMVHHIYRMIVGGALYCAPLAKDQSSPGRVLDLGTGTGIWAIEMAEEFPHAIVVGTDLSPIQPGWIPPNCKFYVDDFESDWDYQPHEWFDYIHGRALCGSVANWPRFFEQAYQNLNPGGWLEMQEYQTWLFSDDNTMENAAWIREWSIGTDEASTKFGRRLRTAQDMKKWMEEAGFLDVHEEIYKVPIGTWPKDRKLKQLGKFYRAALLDSLEPFALALYTRVHRYTTDELQILIAGVRGELLDPKMHMYVPFHFVYGRKP